MKIRRSLSVLFFTLAFVSIAASSVEAAAFTSVMFRPDRLGATQTTGGMICATTPGSDTGTDAKAVVTFPSGFTVNTTAANWTVTSSNLPSGATSWPGIGTATSVAGQAVYFPSSNLGTSTQYCFNFSGTSTLTQNATPTNDETGSVATLTSGSASLDSGSYATSTVGSTADQITVSATVSPTFTISISGTTFALGTVGTGSVATSGNVNVTLTTNAAAGWILWIKDATANNGNMTSASTGATFPFAGTQADNAETDLTGATGYGVHAEINTDAANGGTVSQASNFGAEYGSAANTCGSGSSVGALQNTFLPAAASNGAANGDVIRLCARAKASGLQQAATDYTDTVTITAAGRF